MTHLRVILARQTHEATAHLILDAYAQRIARWAAARCVRVRDARPSLVALEVVCATAAAEFVRVGGEGGRGGCGFGDFGEGGCGLGRAGLVVITS